MDAMNINTPAVPPTLPRAPHLPVPLGENPATGRGDRDGLDIGKAGSGNQPVERLVGAQQGCVGPQHLHAELGAGVDEAQDPGARQEADHRAGIGFDDRQLAHLALTHAVRSVVPDGGPLVPFSLVEKCGTVRMKLLCEL